MGWTADEVAIVAVGSCLLLLHLALAGWAACRRARWCEWWASWRLCLCRWMAATRGAEDDGEDKEDDERKLENYVAVRLAHRRVQEGRKLTTWLTCAVSVNTFTIIVNICANRRLIVNAPGDDVAQLVFLALFLLLFARPELITNRSIPYWYSAIMVGVCTWLWPAKTPTYMLRRALLLGVVRLVSSAVLMRPSIVACWQAVYTAYSWSSFLEMYSRSQTDMSVPLFVTAEFCWSLHVVYYTHQVAKSSRDRLREEVKSATLLGGCSAMRGLLDLMCDVVVELGSHLQLKTHVPRFSALVTLGDSEKSFKGAPMQSFIPLVEDKQHFKECLLSGDYSSDDPGSHGTAPGVLHTKLRDAIGNHLSVEMFYVRFISCGETSYLVGIREEADRSNCPVPELQSLEENAATKKKKAAKPNNGTPPVAIGRPLGQASNDDGDQVSAGSSSDDSETGHVDAGGGSSSRPADVMLTTTSAKLFTLTKAMEQWIHEVRRCCPWHSSVAAAKATLCVMENYSCSPNFRVRGDRQCRKCGALVDLSAGLRGSGKRKACTICEGRQFWRIAPESLGQHRSRGLSEEGLRLRL